MDKILSKEHRRSLRRQKLAILSENEFSKKSNIFDVYSQNEEINADLVIANIAEGPLVEFLEFGSGI